MKVYISRGECNELLKRVKGEKVPRNRPGKEGWLENVRLKRGKVGLKGRRGAERSERLKWSEVNSPKPSHKPSIDPGPGSHVQRITLRLHHYKHDC